MDVSLSVLKSGETILCGDQCKSDHEEANQPAAFEDRTSEATYRGGYEYACGYHD